MSMLMHGISDPRAAFEKTSITWPGTRIFLHLTAVLLINLRRIAQDLVPHVLQLDRPELAPRLVQISIGGPLVLRGGRYRFDVLL